MQFILDHWDHFHQLFFFYPHHPSDPIIQMKLECNCQCTLPYFNAWHHEFTHLYQRSSDGQIKNNVKHADEGYGEEEDEHSETLCGACGGNYSPSEFWIGCDVCERWFHGKCVKITPAKAESIKQYKCPSCSSKRGRQ